MFGLLSINWKRFYCA